MTDAMTILRSVIKDRRQIVVTTMSGSRYTLSRSDEKSPDWNVVRRGCEGRVSYLHAARVFWDSDTNDLHIGPWATTGLSEVEITG